MLIRSEVKRIASQTLSPKQIVYVCFIASFVFLIFYGTEISAYIAHNTGYSEAKINAGYQTIPIVVGNTSINAIVADTYDKKSLGLSGRKTLLKDQGMIFMFETPDRYGIWMKDMNFSIDILWVNENLVVVDHTSNVSPKTFPKVFEPKEDSLYIIELPSGFIDNHSIADGTSVILYR